MFAKLLKQVLTSVSNKKEGISMFAKLLGSILISVIVLLSGLAMGTAQAGPVGDAPVVGPNHAWESLIAHLILFTLFLVLCVLAVRRLVRQWSWQLFGHLAREMAEFVAYSLLLFAVVNAVLT